MAIKINRTIEIMARLEKEGKVKVMNDDPKFREKRKEWNRYMAEVRRDSKRRSFNSWMAASKFLLTS